MKWIIRAFLRIWLTLVLLVTVTVHLHAAANSAQVAPLATPDVATDEAAAPSPAGRTYEVFVFGNIGGPHDCWVFGADGSFSASEFFGGPGTWQLLSSEPDHATWTVEIGSPILGAQFNGGTFAAGGRFLVASGLEFASPNVMPFIAYGFANPFCVASAAAPEIQ